jgi:hypothetical protein
VRSDGIKVGADGNPIEDVQKKSSGTKKNRIPPMEIKEISKETYKKHEEERRVVEETKEDILDLKEGMIEEGNIRIGMSPVYRKAHGFTDKAEKKVESVAPRNTKNSYTYQKQLEKVGNYRSAIIWTCEKFKIPEDVFLQLLSKENRSFNPSAVSVA